MSIVVQKISLDAKAEKIVANLQTLPKRVLNFIVAAMSQENKYTVSHIQSAYLSFPAHGPTTPIGLRQISGDYARSLRDTEPSVQGQTIDSAIGSPVKNHGFSYPRLHEFGGHVVHKAREIRFRTDARGNLLTRSLKRMVGDKVVSSPNSMLIFAKDSDKQAVAKQAKGWETDYPARAPIQKGIKDRMPEYSKSISAHILQAWQGQN